MIDSQPIIPPSAQNNLISPAPIIPKAKRIIRNNGITLPIIKNPIPRNILLPYTDKQSHRHGKNNPSVINFAVRISMIMAVPATVTGKRVKKMHIASPPVLYFSQLFRYCSYNRKQSVSSLVF